MSRKSFKLRTKDTDLLSEIFDDEITSQDQHLLNIGKYKILKDIIEVLQSDEEELLDRGKKDNLVRYVSSLIIELKSQLKLFRRDVEA